MEPGRARATRSRSPRRSLSASVCAPWPVTCRSGARLRLAARRRHAIAPATNRVLELAAAATPPLAADQRFLAAGARSNIPRSPPAGACPAARARRHTARAHRHTLGADASFAHQHALVAATRPPARATSQRRSATIPERDHRRPRRRAEPLCAIVPGRRAIAHLPVRRERRGSPCRICAVLDAAARPITCPRPSLQHPEWQSTLSSFRDITICYDNRAGSAGTHCTVHSPAVASRYGQGLWFGTRTTPSSTNGSQRARRSQSSSEPGSSGNSQTRAARSKLAVTTRTPSGLNAAATTAERCSRGSVRGLPVRASQTRAVWSSLAVTTRAPSGLNAAAVTRSRCSRGSVRACRCARPRPARCGRRWR
jgi:hypothetical protein